MNILTFDIEDWYCHDNYSQNMEWDKHEVRIHEPLERILSELEKKKVKGTFFCLGWLAQKHPEVIRTIHEKGHHVGCHSYQHELALRLDYKAFKNNTFKSKALLEDITGEAVDAFRAPSFSVMKQNLYVFDVLAELGFKYDCSIFPANREFGGLKEYGEGVPGIINVNGYRLKEFPMNVYRFLGKDIIFSGGGYFRILPYRLTRYFMRHSDYVINYFHPSDFDPAQPRMKHLPLMRQIKNSMGLRGAFEKYQKLIRDFDFVDIRQADSLIDWDKVKTFDIKNIQVI